MNRRPETCQCGDHAFLTLTRGYCALISPEDAPLVSMWVWRADVRKNVVYAMRAHGRHKAQKRLYMHRFLMKPAPGRATHTDHKNRDGIDNRRENLRTVSPSENQGNRCAIGGSSKFKGVSFNKRLGKWHSYIKDTQKRVHLGFFEDEEEAARTYDAAAKSVFGECALTNEMLGLLEK